MSDTTYDNQSAQHTEGSTPQMAADQAKTIATDVKQSGAQVAGTAKDETLQVASDAKDQAKDLLHQVRGEMSEQTSAQQRRAAGGLRALADELAAMSQNSGQSGVASDLASQASQRVRSVAGWMEEREPGDLVMELKGFARRKPGAFLAAAVAVGLLGGRLTRGLTADQADTSQPGLQYRGGLPNSGGSPGRTNGSGTMPLGGYGDGMPPEVPTLGANGDRGTPPEVPTLGANGDRGTPPEVPVVTGTSHGEPVTYTTGSGAGTAMTGIPEDPADPSAFKDTLAFDDPSSGELREPDQGGTSTGEDDRR